MTIAGSCVWGTVCLYAGLAMFFPGEDVKNYVKYEVQESTSKKYLIDLDELGFGLLGNLQATNLTVYQSKPGRRDRGQKETPPRKNTKWFSVPSLSVRPQLLSLLRGRLMTAVGVQTPGGDLDMSVGGDLTNLYLDIDTDGLDLSLIPLEIEDSLVQLSGSLEIESDLEFNREEIKESSGDLSVEVEDLALVSGTISGFSLPETAFSEAVLQMEVENGRLNVKKGSFISDVLEVTVDGYINLRKNLLRSNANLKIQIRFDDTYDKLAKLALKSSRDDDGVYHFRGSGRVNNLRFRADRTKSRNRDVPASQDNFDDARPSASDRPSRKSSALSSEEREERRQKRRERLQERRERMKQRREERRAASADRIERQQRQQKDPVDDFDPLEPQYDEDQMENMPQDDLPQQRYDDEIDQGPDEYQEEQEYDDPNGNMEDIGYIDE